MQLQTRFVALLLTAGFFTWNIATDVATAAESAPGTSETTTETKSPEIESSVVKVFSTVRYPDPYKPWSKSTPQDVTGSGVVIEGKRILSNAHVVLYASQIQIQANQSGDKISATVESISPDMDLAVLKLDDETFFDSHPALPRANKFPENKDVVLAYGYPEGGNSLSITKGIVSRIEFEAYTLSVAGLRIQIDAAINPGNSGGAAVVGDKMIGLTFSRLNSADNIGYIIPCEEIELFLKDVADGRYDGKPAMYDDLQTLENPALRSYLKLDKSAEGIVVHKPASSDASYPLKEWDLITKIGDSPVDVQGMVKVGDNLRVRFQYMVQNIAKDGKVPLTVIRAGKEVKIELPVNLKREALINGLAGGYPSYFICGPVVFSTATTEFLGGLARGARGATAMSTLALLQSPLVTRLGDKPAFDGEQLVVISSPFFPDKLSTGYSPPNYQVVKSVNGIHIKNLNHLVEVLRDSKDEFITIEFDYKGGETLVFPRKELLASTDEILTDNGVRSQGSPDTLAVWNAKPAK
jgi:S1-C subfamily serine protease